RLPLRAQPGLLIETDSFNDKRIPFPLAHGISVPPRIGIVRELPAIHPDFPQSMVALEKHEDSSWNLDDLKRPDREHHAREPHRIALEDRIVPTRRGFRTIAGIIGVVLCLSPAG